MSFACVRKQNTVKFFFPKIETPNPSPPPPASSSMPAVGGWACRHRGHHSHRQICAHGEQSDGWIHTVGRGGAGSAVVAPVAAHPAPPRGGGGSGGRIHVGGRQWRRRWSRPAVEEVESCLPPAGSQSPPRWQWCHSRSPSQLPPLLARPSACPEEERERERTGVVKKFEVP